MPIRNFLRGGLTTIATAATLAASLSSASAMTLEAPSAQRSLFPPQVERVWYCR